MPWNHNTHRIQSEYRQIFSMNSMKRSQVKKIVCYKSPRLVSNLGCIVYLWKFRQVISYQSHSKTGKSIEKCACAVHISAKVLLQMHSTPNLWNIKTYNCVVGSERRRVASQFIRCAPYSLDFKLFYGQKHSYDVSVLLTKGKTFRFEFRTKIYDHKAVVCNRLCKPRNECPSVVSFLIHLFRAFRCMFNLSSLLRTLSSVNFIKCAQVPKR